VVRSGGREMQTKLKKGQAFAGSNNERDGLRARNAIKTGMRRVTGILRLSQRENSGGGERGFSPGEVTPRKLREGGRATKADRGS